MKFLEKVPKSYYTKDAAEAWRTAKNIVECFGTDIITEDNQICREFENLLIIVEEPSKGYPVAGSGWNMIALEKYYEQFRGAEKGDFAYTYGERLFNFEGVNQIEHITNKLRKSERTRRAVAFTWKITDHFNNYVPCLIFLEFSIRQNKLSLSVTFRSHDIGRAYVPNMYALSRIMEDVAKDLNKEAGKLCLYSVNAHIYR